MMTIAERIAVAAGRFSGDAAAAEVVEEHVVAELVGKRIDRVSRRPDVRAFAEPFGGEFGERHQVDQVDGGRGG
jgi:hypothetical protein